MSGDRAVAAVLLAAGSSRRMGEVNKLLSEVEGRALVARAAAALIDGGASPVIAVTGHQADAVAAALAGLGVERVDNPDHEAGMGTSIAAGVQAIGARASAVLIALGDMPRVTPATIRALIDAHRRDPEAALAPAIDGRRGHPVLFPASTMPALASLAGDRGARAVFAAVRHELIEVDDPGVALDIDTPAQLDRARRSDS